MNHQGVYKYYTSIEPSEYPYPKRKPDDLHIELHNDFHSHRRFLDNYIKFEDESFAFKYSLLTSMEREVFNLIKTPIEEQIELLKNRLFEVDGLIVEDIYIEDHKHYLYEGFAYLFKLINEELKFIHDYYLVGQKTNLFYLYFEPNKNYFLLRDKKNEKPKMSTKEFMAYIDIMNEVDKKNYPKINIGTKQFFNKYKTELKEKCNCSSHDTLRNFTVQNGSSYNQNYLHIYRTEDWSKLSIPQLIKLIKSIDNVKAKFINTPHKKTIQKLNIRTNEINNFITEKENLKYNI